MEEVEKSGHIGHHHSSNVQPVDFEIFTNKYTRIAQHNGDVRQMHRRTEVEKHRQEVITHIQGGPDATLIGSTEEDEEEERRHYEAEDGHEHHPAQRVFRLDMSRCHQGPHQTSKHKLRNEEHVRNGDEDPPACGQNITRGGGSHSPKHCVCVCACV